MFLHKSSFHTGYLTIAVQGSGNHHVIVRLVQLQIRVIIKIYFLLIINFVGIFFSTLFFLLFSKPAMVESIFLKNFTV